MISEIKLCNYCKSLSQYICHCSIYLCDNHYASHKKVCNSFTTNKTEDCEKIKKLSFELTKKIKKIENICCNLVLETREAIKKIEECCRRSLRKLENLKNKYLNIIEKGNLGLLEEETNKKIIEAKDLTLDLKSIAKYYFQDFFSEKIEFRTTEDLKKMLKIEYELIIESHNDWINSATLSLDNIYAVLGSDNSVKIWNLIEKHQEVILKGHTNWVNCVAISNDNKYIVSGSWDKSIIVWNFEKKSQEIVFLGHTDIVNSVSITNDNKKVVSCSWDKSVRLWNLEKKRQEIVLQGHTSSVNIAVFAYNENYVVSGGDDKTVRIWNLRKKCQEALLNGHSSSVNMLAITHDDKYIISSGNDKSLKIWNLQEKQQVGEIIEYKIGNPWVVQYPVIGQLLRSLV